MATIEELRRYRLVNQHTVGQLTLSFFETNSPQETTQFWTLSGPSAGGEPRHFSIGRMEELRPRLEQLANQAHQLRRSNAPDGSQAPQQNYWPIVRGSQTLRDGYGAIMEVVEVKTSWWGARLAVGTNPELAVWDRPIPWRPSPGDKLVAAVGDHPRLDRLIDRCRRTEEQRNSRVVKVGELTLSLRKLSTPHGGDKVFWSLQRNGPEGGVRTIEVGWGNDLAPQLERLAIQARERSQARAQAKAETRQPGLQESTRDPSRLSEAPKPTRHEPTPAAPRTASPLNAPERMRETPDRKALVDDQTQRRLEREQPTRLGIWQGEYRPAKGQVVRWKSTPWFEKATQQVQQTNEAGGTMTPVSPPWNTLPSNRLKGPLYVVGKPVGLPQEGLCVILGAAADLDRARQERAYEDAWIRNQQRHELKESIALFGQLDLPDRQIAIDHFQEQLDALGPAEPIRPLEQRLAAIDRVAGINPTATTTSRQSLPGGPRPQSQPHQEQAVERQAMAAEPTQPQLPHRLRQIANEYTPPTELQPEPKPIPAPGQPTDKVQFWPVVRVKQIKDGQALFEVVACFDSFAAADKKVHYHNRESHDLAMWAHPFPEPLPEKTTLRADSPMSDSLKRLVDRAQWKQEVQGPFASLGTWADRNYTPVVGDTVKRQVMPEEATRPVDYKVVPANYNWEANRYTRQEPVKPIYTVLRPDQDQPGVWRIVAITEDRQQAVSQKQQIDHVRQAHQDTLDQKKWQQMTLTL